MIEKILDGYQLRQTRERLAAVREELKAIPQKIEELKKEQKKLRALIEDYY